jgi:hypothetical protein
MPSLQYLTVNQMVKIIFKLIGKTQTKILDPKQVKMLGHLRKIYKAIIILIEETELFNNKGLT